MNLKVHGARLRLPQGLAGRFLTNSAETAWGLTRKNTAATLKCLVSNCWFSSWVSPLLPFVM